MEDRLLSVSELGRWLNLSIATIYSKIKAGRIPFSKVGARYRFSKAEIETWMRNPDGVPQNTPKEDEEDSTSEESGKKEASPNKEEPEYETQEEVTETYETYEDEEESDSDSEAREQSIHEVDTREGDTEISQETD